MKGLKHWGLPGEAEFPVSPQAVKHRHYLHPPFCLLWGCWWGGSTVTLLWQLSQGRTHHLHWNAASTVLTMHWGASQSAAAWDYQQIHIILRDWHILGLHLVYNLEHSGYVIVTFLKRDCSLGNPGQMAEILPFQLGQTTRLSCVFHWSCHEAAFYRAELHGGCEQISMVWLSHRFIPGAQDQTGRWDCSASAAHTEPTQLWFIPAAVLGQGCCSRKQGIVAVH